MANHYSVRFLETSAKECKNVDQAFQLMTREIKNNVASSTTKGNPQKPAQTLKPGSTAMQKKKQGCCK